MGNQAALPQCYIGDDSVAGEFIIVPCDANSPLGHERTSLADVITHESVRAKASFPFAQGSPVHLNVYHLNDNWLKSNQISNQLFGVGGAFHAGIEVHGLEWAYGDAGITPNDPRSHEVHVYHESILLGETDLSADEVVTLVKKMERDWHGQEYDMLNKNCCNFADVFSQELVGESIPSWVTRFPHIASQAAAHLDNVIDVKGIVDGMCPVAPGDVPPVSPAKGNLAYSNRQRAKTH